MDDLFNNLKVYESEVKGVSSSTNTQNVAFMSSSSNNFNSSNGVNTAQGVNTANGVYTASSQVNTASSLNIDNMSDAMICAFLASQPNSTHFVNEDLEQIHPDDLEEMDLKWQMAMLTMRARRFLKNTGRKLNLNGNDSVAFDKTKLECYNCHKRGHFSRECMAPRQHDSRNREATKRTVPIETPNSSALVSCDGLGGYDWSDQAEEGPTNYALMAYSTSSASSLDSEVSNCSKSCLKAVENLTSTNEQLIKDLRKSEIMVVAYKEGLKSVEQRLEFFKNNESNYLKEIKVLKLDIHCRDRAITELQRKLELAQTEKDSIQLNVDKLENASKSLNKIIECQIMDNCKEGLGCNAVPPPHTGLFAPLKSDLSYRGLEEFSNEPKIEESKDKSTDIEPESVRKSNEAPIIED
ncbi:ribonuclease H-like domain-containing protein [Tanacetum coccineum]